MAKKKKFMVVAREGSAVLKGLETGKGHKSFNGKSFLYVDDAGEAAEIEQKYGKKGTQDVYVARDEQLERALNGEQWEVKSSLAGDHVKVAHNYFFGPQRSKAAADFWKRYERKKKQKAKNANS